MEEVLIVRFRVYFQDNSGFVDRVNIVCKIEKRVKDTKLNCTTV